MRLKTLLLFVAIQVLSFSIWANMPSNTAVEASEPFTSLSTATHEAAENNNVKISFSTRNFTENQIHNTENQQTQIKNMLAHLPHNHTSTVKKIILDYNPKAGRGLGGSNMIILRGSNISDNELLSVLVHEIGHNVDFSYLIPKYTDVASNFKDGKTPLYVTDPSIEFFSISWKDEKTLKKTSSNLDFVSGYAMSDPFEDFAESYVYYVLHNKDFKTLTASSDQIFAKYQFMKYQVFAGQEFNTGKADANINIRPWDITVLDYDLNNFLT